MSDKYYVIGVIGFLFFISIGGCYDMYLEAQKEMKQIEIKKLELEIKKDSLRHERSIQKN